MSEKDFPPSSSFTRWLVLFLLLPGLAGLSYLLTVVALGVSLPALASTAVSPSPSSVAAIVTPTVTAVSSFPLTGATVIPSATPAPAAVPSTDGFPFPSGSRRSEPYPFGGTAELEFWQVRVTGDILRGDAAWRRLAEANSFNEPPPDGWEYLLVRLGVGNQHSGADEVSLGIHVTGDSNVVHFGFDADVVAPEPALETYLPPGGESEGWEAFRIRTGESNLMLVLDDFANYEEAERYLALEPGAALTIPAEMLDAIHPTDIGETAVAPAALNEAVTAADWQVTITELIRGRPAWEWLQEVNSYNDPAPEGMEYLLIYARVRYIGADPGPVSITRRDFWLLDEDGEAYEYPSVVHPQPELFADLFPGGETEGWMVMQVQTDHRSPLLGFNPSPYGPDSAANERYFEIGR